MVYQTASTDWFAGSIGISVHWTSHSKPLSGKAQTFQNAVEEFDLDGFMRQIKKSGAKHLIFTTTHAEHKLPAPHPVIDYLQAGRTCGRDLLGEIAQRLKQEGVRLILYYNHACNGDDDAAWKKACGYLDAPLDLFAARILQIVECLSRRYGDLVSGWWFDSSYSVDPRGPHNSITTEIGDWQFPWDGLSAAAKSGNPQSIVCFNSGVDVDFLYSTHQDYYAGETTSLRMRPQGRYIHGLQLHQWFCLDNRNWVHTQENTPFVGPAYTDEQVQNFTRQITCAGGAVTYNMEIAQTGLINPSAIEQMERLIKK